MAVGYKGEYKATTNGIEIERADMFKYLGEFIATAGSDKTEIGSRIDKTVKLFYALNSNFL